MTYDQRFTPPPPAPMVIIGRHGSKLKVRILGLTKIVDRAQAVAWAKERRAAGAYVNLNFLLREEEIA
jgi:hypothetical protein